MSWAISTRGIARISSFEAAERHWADNKPWRNVHRSYRPLDDRRMVHKRLVKQSDGAYACTLYNQAIVAYRPDGSVRLTCHDSVSSNAFAWSVKPRGCQPVSHQGQMFWVVMTDDGKHFYRQGEDTLVLEPTASGNWALITEPATVREWKYDPKKGAAARKLVKPYTIWFETSKRLGMELPTHIYPRDYCIPCSTELLAKFSDGPTIRRLAQVLGPPVNVLNSAYLHTGARYLAPAPPDRLPRRTT